MAGGSGLAPRPVAKLAATLAADERERAARFRFAEHRDRFIAKALGGGLASGLRNLEVCFLDGGLPDGRVSLRDAAGREWSVLNLPLDPGWAGALAAAGTDWRATKSDESRVSP
jgi:hypothetical protein